MKPMRAYAVFLLVLLLAGYSLASVAFEQRALYANSVRSHGDAITRYLDRFRGVRERMPGSGAFGYFSDISEHTENRAAMALTQYVLAPLVLRESTDLQSVIGNFHRGSPDPEAIRQKGLILRYDSGSGVMLFGRGTR